MTWKVEKAVEFYGSISMRMNPTTDVGFLGTLQHANTADRTYTAPDYSGALVIDPTPLTPAWAATMDITPGNARLCRVTLGGTNTTINLITTGQADGRPFILETLQDATGGRGIIWGSGIRFGADLLVGSATPSAGATKLDRWAFIFNLAANVFDMVGYVRGF